MWENVAHADMNSEKLALAVSAEHDQFSKVQIPIC